MGKNKKGFNWRARQVVDTVIDDSSTKKIQIEIDKSKSNYDSCNALVLPSVKRKTKIKKSQQTVTKILSKKQRKRLEKIVEKKTKKENRASLLEALSQVQATPEELSQLTSIASVQTKGLKKFNLENEADFKPKKQNIKSDDDIKINSISGSKRKRLTLINHNLKKFKSDDPNIVGIESDEETSESEDSVDEENNGVIEDIDDLGREKEMEVETNACNNEIKDKIKLKTIKKVNKKDTENSDEEIIQEILNKSIESDKLKTQDSKEKKNADKNTKNKNIKSEKDNNKTPIKNLESSTEKKVQKTIYVPVDRSSEIQKSRLKLPILAEEQEIMETINENSVIVIAGETGSGKTTQIPQFLYEAGYAQSSTIAITEPRRVAAIAMSRRVAQEMNLSSKEVSYLIRFEGNVGEDTKIKFMTDGVLLKEIKNDFLLTKYSIVVLDEAHERSVYTDILIGLLSRIVPLRIKKEMPLKLIIMSATLRLEDFTENTRLFKTPPPVIKVDARQFPVTVHFNKRTQVRYTHEAFNKAVKIHTKLPEGGILIFVSGQQEVNRLVKKLRKTFPLRNKHKTPQKPTENTNNTSDSSDSETEKKLLKTLQKKKKTIKLPHINLDDYALPGVEEDDINPSNSEYESSDSESDVDIPPPENCQPMWALPLFSLLPTNKQSRVFEAPPPGCRLCVVSTNVAETSLTIPNVKYVVDSGKCKVKLYDKVTGVTSYQVGWTSKASANQRAGRAGRVAPGHCYRLYSSAVFNDEFQEFAVPEIQQKPVDDLYLQMKCMNIDKVINFPFPTAPDLLQLKTAEKRLEILGAISGGKVTALGKAIAQFPVLPRFGKMLALSHQQGLLPYTICMAAALSVQEVLLETPVFGTREEVKTLRQKWAGIRRFWAGHGQSLLLGEPMVLLRAVGAAEYANTQHNLEKFCNDNGLRHKAVVEIRKLRIQLTNSIKLNVENSDVVVDPNLKPPNETQARLLRQILLSGMGDQVAKKINSGDIRDDEDKSKYKYAYRSINMEEPIFLHSGSVLKKSLPEFVIYQEVYETNKMYMRGVTAIEPEWLPMYVPQLCNLSEPLSDPEPLYRDGKIYCTVTGTFGRQGFQLPVCEIEYPKSQGLYKYFAKFLLEGKIFKKLAKYTDVLLSKPNSMVKSWAKLQIRTEFLLKALIAKDVNSKMILENIWSKNPSFLLAEYQKWVPESAYNEVALMWPPLGI